MSKKPGIYETLVFHEQPYDQNEKFSVYIPRQEDRVTPLIHRSQAQTPAGRLRSPHELFPQSAFPQSTGGAAARQSFRDKLVDQVQATRNDGETAAAHQLVGSTDAQEGHQSTTQLQHASPDARLTLKTAPSHAQNTYTRTQSLRGTAASQQQQQLSLTRSVYYGNTAQRSMQKLREKLYFDEKTRTVPKTTLKNKFIENIVQDGDVFLKNKQLLDSVYKLKQLNLLKQHDVHVNRFPGVGKFSFVYNDVHSKSTNPGYSRNKEGGYFYTR